MRGLIVLSWSVALLIAGLWGVTYFGSNTFYYAASGRVFAIDSFAGEFSLWAGSAPQADKPLFRHVVYPRANSYGTKGVGVQNPGGSELWFLGFCITDRRRFPCTISTPVPHVWGLAIPFWAPFAASVGLAVLLMRRFGTKNTRRRQGCCVQCGYDLRAHDTGGRCPECGAAVPARANAPHASASAPQASPPRTAS